MAETGRKKRLPELGRLNGRNGFLSKNSKEGSPLKQCPGGSPKRPSSPEPNCSICLGGIEDQSFANKCFHSFCKTCLFEWSKIKPECPVCRQGFDSIIFNVKAMDDYEECIIPRPPSPRRVFPLHQFFVEPLPSPHNFDHLRRRVIHLASLNDHSRPFANFARSRGRAFNPLARLSELNNSSERFPPRAHESSRSSVHQLDLDTILAARLDHLPQPSRTPVIGTCDHRRYIYENDLWVQPLTAGRLERKCSALFYRSNPAVTHRLLPFLNRELIAILRTDQESNHTIEAFLSRIKIAIFEYDIPSIRFRQVVEPVILDKTHHFLHELFYFARSPYTIEDYNNHAVYVPRAQVRTLKLETEVVHPPLAVLKVDRPELDSDSSTDDSVIEVVDSDQEQSSSEDRRLHPQLAIPLTIATTSTTTSTITSYTINSKEPTNDQSNESQLPAISICDEVIRESQEKAHEVTPPKETSPLDDLLPKTLPQNINVIEDFDNPRPGPSGLCRNTIDFKPSNQKSSLDGEGSDFEIDIGGSPNKPRTSKKQTFDSDSEDSDDSIKVVGFKKPIRERTPEVINISSCGESDDEKEERKVDDQERDGDADAEDDDDEDEDDDDDDDDGPLRKRRKILNRRQDIWLAFC